MSFMILKSAAMGEGEEEEDYGALIYTERVNSERQRLQQAAAAAAAAKDVK